MATQKSSRYPYQWPNGEWHSITWAAERARQMTQITAQRAQNPIAQPSPTSIKGQQSPLLAPPSPTSIKGLPVSPTSLAPTQPAATSTTPAPASGGSAEIVPDAQFLAEAAQRAFQRTTKLNELTEEGKTDRTQAQEAVRRMLEDALEGRRTINEGANKEGLFYSGQLNKRQGVYEQAVQRARGDVETSLQSREDARARAMAALQQGAPLEEATALASAGQRQVIRDTSAADLNALVPNTPAPAATAVPAVKQLVNRTNNSRAGQTYTEQPGVKNGASGTWHVYAGKRIWVPKRR